MALAGANVAVATDRTVLNSEFVTDEFEEQGVYANITETVEDQVGSEFEGGEIRPEEDLPPGITADPIDPQQVTTDAITREYVRTEFNKNIERFYAFLHGESDRVNASVNLTPIKDTLQQEVEGMNIQVDAAEAFAESGAVDGNQAPVSGEDVAALEESEQSFDQTRTKIWVDIVFEQTSDEDLLLLIGENPNDYPDNEQGVRENEEEIRNTLRSELGSYDDLPDEAKQQIDQLNQELKDQSAQQLEQQDGLNDNLTQGLQEMQFTVIDGLTGDITYDEYTEQLSSAESDVATEIERMIQDRIDEDVPNQLQPEEEITRQSNPELDTASTQVQRVGLIKWVLVLLSAVLIGLIALVTRSFGWTSATSGVAMSLVGVVGVVIDFVFREAAIQFLEGQLQQDVEEEFVQELLQSFLGVLESAIGTYGTQSLILLVLGIVLIGLAILNRAGVLDPVWEALGLEDEPDDGAGETSPGASETVSAGTAGAKATDEDVTEPAAAPADSTDIEEAATDEIDSETEETDDTVDSGDESTAETEGNDDEDAS